MSSMDMLDVGQAHELKLACRRNGVTPEDLKWLCEGTNLADLRRVRFGFAKIVTLSCAWYEQDGIIHFTVTRKKVITGEQWIERLSKRGFLISDEAKEVLRSSDFHSTLKSRTKIAVLKSDLFGSGKPTYKEIRAFAKEHRFVAPEAEIACLIRETFSDEDIEMMGLKWIAVMHEHNTNQFGLSAFRGEEGHILLASYEHPDVKLNRECGFAFMQE